METIERLAEIARVPATVVKDFADKTDSLPALERVLAEFDREVARVNGYLGIKEFDKAALTRLREEILTHEKELYDHVQTLPGTTDLDKAAHLARSIARVEKGFFLKREFAEKILKARPPANLLAFLKYESVEEMLAHHDVTEAFSALRFMESDEWMHETFDKAYSNFTAEDFEEREIELRVLGPEWHEVAKKFVEKKKHNVSHLKEFGVIFLNPVAEDVPGKFLRDFALLFHYFHEVEFYSKLFRKFAAEPNFAANFKALLRGDIKDLKDVPPGSWLIVQRYLEKFAPNDPILSAARVNPESLHWRRGEMDIVHFAKKQGLKLALWENLDWVGIPSNGEILSLDLEDVAMSSVSLHEGTPVYLNYHQQEAIWLRIFTECVGSEEKLAALLLDNFASGVIPLGKK